MRETTASATVTPVAGYSQPKKCIHGRLKEILIAFAVMTVPMIAFSALLLGLVFHYRVVLNDFASENLAFDSGQNDSGVFFVNISATTLITIASWSSTVAPILVGFAVTLISYPVASGILSASVKQKPGQLPTPYQFSLLLKMLTSGSPSALWSWLQYSFGWRGRREGQAKSLKTLTSILTLGIILSTLVFATDTWLHFTTKTVNFFQVTPTLDPSDLSFGVYDNCTDVTETNFYGCNMDNPASGAVLMSSIPIEVLSNISNTMLVQTHTVGNDQFAYLVNAQLPRLASIDYSARSYAVRSQCKPVTSDCMSYLDVYGVGTDYHCPFAFQGTADTSVGSSNSVTMAYFTDSSGSNNNTDTNAIANPYYYAAVAVVNMRNGPSVALLNDPQILKGGHGGSTIIALFCNSIIYDLEYTSVNGTITRFVTTLSNSSVTNILQGTQRLTQAGDANLVQAASVAGLGDSAQAISNQFALSYSQTALAVASGAFQPLPALESQSRETMLVARVPKAPLACLLAANLSLAVLGIVLTVVAVSCGSGETNEVQARLSIPALVASQFEEARVRAPVEKVEDMFEEGHGKPGPRIGFVRSPQGAWIFSSWRPA
ncbi:uncharacterized protein A1O5_06258 [Cladophialophora psammophila CBS 110553]|uniref:Uncharacterized protein n=1 Tax=Cladophialophora psammophila CBS 110553 TaxID=1182543 RepID=W9WYN8_9EURO|nr:uncharacterized protein A1O5_06258 [Cladophialophora psammophila CBS 110553]EXJ70190.1 hypothetical protein A1O5_06258 [Cladophialophora psammophila CBS 110553]